MLPLRKDSKREISCGPVTASSRQRIALPSHQMYLLGGYGGLSSVPVALKRAWARAVL